MSSLFIDTSNHLVIGLLDHSFGWLEYIETENSKSSGILHKTIYDLLSKHDLEAKDLTSIFQVSGPGSYTGMRLSEGLCQIFEWEGIKKYSFYHFEVPRLLGNQKGRWLSYAFKGEVFLYEWDENEEQKFLYKETEFLNTLDSFQGEYYSHFPPNLGDKVNENLGHINSTLKMIENHPTELFALVERQKIQRSPYYYRTIEKEFKTSFGNP